MLEGVINKDHQSRKIWKCLRKESPKLSR